MTTSLKMRKNTNIKIKHMNKPENTHPLYGHQVKINDCKVTPWDIHSCWIDFSKNAKKASVWPQDLGLTSRLNTVSTETA